MFASQKQKQQLTSLPEDQEGLEERFINDYIGKE
jgi:hypothetical protein